MHLRNGHFGSGTRCDKLTVNGFSSGREDCIDQRISVWVNTQKMACTSCGHCPSHLNNIYTPTSEQGLLRFIQSRLPQRLEFGNPAMAKAFCCNRRQIAVLTSKRNASFNPNGTQQIGPCCGNGRAVEFYLGEHTTDKVKVVHNDNPPDAQMI
jgi:hypothetical protein